MVQYPCVFKNVQKNIFRQIHCALIWSPATIYFIACTCLLQVADSIHPGGPACPLRWPVWGFDAFRVEGHQVLHRRLVTSDSPCCAGWLLVQPSLLLPKREGGSRASRAALRCLPATAPAPLAPEAGQILMGIASWAGGPERCELPCAHGDTTLHLEEVLSRGCCRRRTLVVVFNLLFFSKQSYRKAALKSQISRLGNCLSAVTLQCLLFNE